MVYQQWKKCPEIFHCIGGWLLAPRFRLGQSKARPACSGGDLLCLNVKPVKHMHLLTFQNHFITKMNKRRMLFKLNKLHKHRESRASPGIPSSQVSITKNIQKYWNSGLFHYLALLSCLSHVQTVVCLTLLGFFSKSSGSEVFVNVSLYPMRFQFHLHCLDTWFKGHRCWGCPEDLWPSPTSWAWVGLSRRWSRGDELSLAKVLVLLEFGTSGAGHGESQITLSSAFQVLSSIGSQMA